MTRSQTMLLSSAVAMSAILGPSHVLSEEKPIIGNQGANLSEAELLNLKDRALKGDGHPAFQLANYYTFAYVKQDEALFWSMISAEDGDPSGEYAYAFRLAQRGEARDKLRARFWFQRAKTDGFVFDPSVLGDFGLDPLE